MSLETAWAELNRTLGKSWSWGAYEGKDQFEQALITALALMDKQMRRERQGRCWDSLRGFTVTDPETGQYPDDVIMEDWAYELPGFEVDRFAVTEDGDLIVIDDCGKVCKCPPDRYKVSFEWGNRRGE